MRLLAKTLIPKHETPYSPTTNLTVPTSAGVNFVLQMTTNLESGNRITVSNGIAITGLIITNAPTNAFFRLR
jgi:hypothetical protein